MRGRQESISIRGRSNRAGQLAGPAEHMVEEKPRGSRCGNGRITRSGPRRSGNGWRSDPAPLIGIPRMIRGFARHLYLQFHPLLFCLLAAR